MNKIKKQGCLVLIDLQQGFINYNKEIIPNIKDLLNKYEFDHIVATKYINMPNGPFYRLLNYKEMTEKDENIKLNPFVKSISEKVFYKNLYSCFTDEFITYIKENNIEKLYFSGMDSEACVLASVLDCFEHNIDLEIFVNCCKSNNGKKLEKATEDILKIVVGEDKLNYY